MKKLFALLLALMMVLSLAACGGGNDDKTPSSDDKTPSSSQQQEQEDKAPEADDKGGNTPAASTDYFYDHYDFCEEWMMPDDGVYTGYEYISPDSNKAGNEMVTIRIYDITEEQIEAYIQKIEGQGYEHLIGDSYSKKTDFGTSMIEIDNYLEDGYINIKFDPSI